MLPSLNLGFFTIQMYPFFWGLAWAVGCYGVHQNLPDHQKIKNIIYLLGLFVFSVIGAKYIFDVSGGNYTFSSGLGFVFYGGLLAAALYILILKFFKVQWLDYAIKSLIIFLPLSHAIGRVGCFFAGCCFGINNFPIQLVEAILLVGIFMRIYLLRKSKVSHVLSQYLILYGVLRLILEIFRGDARGVWFGFPPSIWISLVLIYLGFFLSNCRRGFGHCR